MRIISWEEYIQENREQRTENGEQCSLALTVGVFDGVHRGHQALIQRICAAPSPPEKSTRTGERVDEQIQHFLNGRDSGLPGQIKASVMTKSEGPPTPHIPTVVTFRQNPQKILNPAAFTGDIMNLEQKLAVFEDLGVQLTVLIDFSQEFSTINGGVFIDLLLSRPVRLIALGRNFRCGHRLDTGAGEIQTLAGARGVEVWIAPPVMDEGQPVSSSRIRQALAAGRQEEAERLLGRPANISS